MARPQWMDQTLVIVAVLGLASLVANTEAAIQQRVEIPTECPKIGYTGPTVHLAHDKDCTKFYTCSHGKKVEMDCPVSSVDGERLHFNAALQVCDWPDKANCDPVVVQCKGSCPTDYGDFFATLQHKTDCSKYCLCQRGVGIEVLECPHGWHFDVKSFVCQDPSIAKCDL